MVIVRKDKTRKLLHIEMVPVQTIM